MRPRALLLMSRMPWPIDDGGKVVLHQDLYSLAPAFDVTLATLVGPEQMREEVPAAVLRLARRVVRVPHQPPSAPVAAARSVFGHWPFTLERYQNAGFRSTVTSLMRETSPDLVYFSNLHMASYLDCVGETPAILRQQNVESVLLARYAGAQGNPMVRVYARHQSRRLARVEADLCSRVAMVHAIQPEEATYLQAMAPRARVEVVPIGIDPARFAPRSSAGNPTVLILGAFGWAPNADGLNRFLLEGWGVVRERVPGAILRIVGKDLSRISTSGPGIERIGYVDSIESEFARASVLVVPIWVGAGARVKIVEALMAGTPVVSTPLGAEGLGLTPGVHFAEADTATGLAESTAALLLAPERGALMAEAGQRRALETFSLDAVAARTRDLCRAVIG